MVGSLFVCATPIGNLADCSSRLIETLTKVKLIAAEDTRVTQTLLRRYNINTPITRFDAHHEQHKTTALIKRLLSGEDIALVSDAGTPCMSDPGAILVQQAHKHAIRVQSIPGPSAMTAFLSIIGYEKTAFSFVGFFPRISSQLLAMLDRYRPLSALLVGFESPKRLRKTIDIIGTYTHINTLYIGKELSKRYEKVFIGSAQSLLADAGLKEPKGEYVLAIEYSKEQPSPRPLLDTFIQLLRQKNCSNKEITQIAQSIGISKKSLYPLFKQENR